MGRKKKVTTTTTTVVTTEEVVTGKPSITRIALVIDRSGSMGSLRTETFNSINTQLAQLKKDAKLGGRTFVTYIQFDNYIETVFANVRAEDLTEITEDQYVPRGATALYDATLTAINALPLSNDPDDAAYLLVVVTDGEDNASKEISQANLAQRIKQLEANGNWTVTYMLSNIDAKRFTQQMGVSFNNVATYVSNTAGVNIASATVGSSLNSYMTSRSRGATGTKGFYSPNPVNVTTATATPVTPTVVVPVVK